MPFVSGAVGDAIRSGLLARGQAMFRVRNRRAKDYRANDPRAALDYLPLRVPRQVYSGVTLYAGMTGGTPTQQSASGGLTQLYTPHLKPPRRLSVRGLALAKGANAYGHVPGVRLPRSF